MDPALAALDPLAAPPPSLVAAADGERVAAALNGGPLAGAGSAGRVLGGRVEDLRLTGRRWVGRYEVTLDGPDGPRQVALTGELTGELTIDAPAAGPTPSTSVLGDPGWAVTLTDPPLTLGHAGVDRKLPALALLTDPGRARGWLQQTLDAAHPGIRIDRCEPLVARYRPGQRAVVLCHLSYPAAADPSWPATVVAKAYRGGRGAHEYRGLEAVAEAGVARDGLQFARPLAYVPAADVSVQSHLPQDRSLVELVAQAARADRPDAAGSAAGALGSVAAALVTLHRSALRYGGTQVIDEEVASVRSGARKLELLVPAAPGAVEPLLRLVEQLARAVPADRPAPSHGAFRPAQVRLDDVRVGLLDLDGLGTCEPAQDVGRFLAKLRLVALLAAAEPGSMSARTTADLLAAMFLERYATEAQVSAPRVALWETLDLLKALLQSWSRGRPTQTGPVLTLLADRVAALRTG